MAGRKSKEDQARIDAAVAAAASGQGWEIPDPSEVLVAIPEEKLLGWARQLGEFSDAAKKRDEGYLARLFDNEDEVNAFTRKFRAALQYLNRTLKVAGPVQRTDGKWLVQYKAGKVREPEQAPTEPTSPVSPVS